VFTARFGPRDAETLFDRICRENGITHRLTAVRSPTTTGKVERFHKTLRDEFFSKHTFTTIEQAQQALDAFVEDYNALRPHQSLGERTPAERFRLRAVEAPEPVVPDPVVTSEESVAPVRPTGACDRTGTCERSTATAGSSSPVRGTESRGSSPASSSLSGSTETSFASSTATRSLKLTLGAIPWRKRR